jgi:DNA-binding NtrC family response regulator
LHRPERTTPRQRPSAGTNQPSGGRLLLVETDRLIRWSLSTYLQRWFAVDATASAAAAVRLLSKHPRQAVIVSDQMPSEAVDAIARAAHAANPAVRTVLLAAGDAEPRDPGLLTTRIEKPFALSDLARLLGVSDDEIAA